MMMMMMMMKEVTMRRVSANKTVLSSCLISSVVVLVVQWFGVGLVIERSLVQLLAGALSSQLGQLSLPSLWGRQTEYQPAWLGLGRARSLVLGGR